MWGCVPKNFEKICYSDRLLERAGFHCVSMVEVSALGILADACASMHSSEFLERCTAVTRIELTCENEDVDRVVGIIEMHGCISQPGDGIILVSPVERPVKIRTGEESIQCAAA